MEKSKNKSKIFMIISICILILSMSGATFAYFRWTSENISINGDSKCFDIVYTKGPVISNESVILFDENKIINDNKITLKSGMAITGLSAGINSNCSTNGSITINMTVNSLNNAFITGSSKGAFKYVIASYDPSVYSSISLDNMSDKSFDIIERGSVTTNNSRLIIDNLTTTIKGYLIIFYIDGDMAFNDVGESTFSASVSAEVDQLYGDETFVEYLTNLYMSASPSKATVANNGINYYYAPSESMMNDGMNESHVWADGANTGNIRYYGKTPANYIDIGDRDNEGNVVPWRIIGVFKNMKLADGTTDTLVKVIRDESIGNMAWDSNISNDWHNATLKTYLNEGEFYTGLSQNVKGKIATVEWNLGGYNSSKIYSNDGYFRERGDLKCSNCIYNTVWNGNVALMYPSDYGYGTDLAKCNQTLFNYYTDVTNCIYTNWLYRYEYRWLLTPYSSNYNNVWAVDQGGYVDSDTYVGDNHYVSPVLYLKSDLTKISGDGSSIENAYVVR